MKALVERHRAVLVIAIDPHGIKTVGFVLQLIGLAGTVAALFLQESRRKLMILASFTALIALGLAGDRYGDYIISVYNGPRQLTKQQWKTLSSDLEKYRGQQFKDVLYSDEREIFDLSEHLKAALINAGWLSSEPDIGDRLIGTMLDVLITISSQSSDETKSAANALTTVLIKDGIASRARIAETAFKDVILIHISTRSRRD